MTCQNKLNKHLFTFKNQKTLHNYSFARKFPPCTFIDLPENVLLARLFRPACFMFSNNFPTCKFIPAYTSIRHTRVGALLDIGSIFYTSVHGTYYLPAIFGTKIWNFFRTINFTEIGALWTLHQKHLTCSEYCTCKLISIFIKFEHF